MDEKMWRIIVTLLLNYEFTEGNAPIQVHVHL